MSEQVRDPGVPHPDKKEQATEAQAAQPGGQAPPFEQQPPEAGQPTAGEAVPQDDLEQKSETELRGLLSQRNVGAERFAMRKPGMIEALRHQNQS